ncbi:hypothetical protein BASA62_003326 [Batrachochytrium salamandrivorans]|nr:hypothetical protein BASA62_003326 [Batrachochytrium salamandrivorans]
MQFITSFLLALATAGSAKAIAIDAATNANAITEGSDTGTLVARSTMNYKRDDSNEFQELFRRQRRAGGGRRVATGQRGGAQRGGGGKRVCYWSTCWCWW